jgi:predicted nuclease of predicted toxin-antitoxin system
LIRLLLDQGLPRSAGKLLAGVGWDVVHVGDVGLSRAADQQILEFARQEQRVRVTLDADFHALLATSDARSPSVIRVRREGLSAKAICDVLVKIWPHIEQAASKGAVVTVTDRSIRVRELPITEARTRNR